MKKVFLQFYNQIADFELRLLQVIEQLVAQNLQWLANKLFELAAELYEELDEVFESFDAESLMNIGGKVISFLDQLDELLANPKLQLAIPYERQLIIFFRAVIQELKLMIAEFAQNLATSLVVVH